MSGLFIYLFKTGSNRYFQIRKCILYPLTVRDTQVNTIHNAFKYPDVQWPPRFFMSNLSRPCPGCLFDLIAHHFSLSTFSGSPTSLLGEHAKLVLLQGLYITFLSVKVLLPCPNLRALSSLNPLIKRHLIRSLPWAPSIKSNPTLLPCCPATSYLPPYSALLFTITLIA